MKKYVSISIYKESSWGGKGSKVNGMSTPWLVSEGNDIIEQWRQSQTTCCVGHMESFRHQAFIKLNPSYEWISVWERIVCVGSGYEGMGGGWCSSLMSFHSRRQPCLVSS